jgi:lambda repressor-like predicted transcriptional regulator
MEPIMPPDTTMTASLFSDRLLKALGAGYEKTFAEAIGVSGSTVYRWCAGDVPVPQYAVAVLEFLELVPKAFWPERWSDS